jgi:hypothetical protein
MTFGRLVGTANSDGLTECPPKNGGDDRFGNVAHAHGVCHFANRPRRRDHSPSDTPRSTCPSDTRLARCRRRGASEQQPGSALGRSASGNGAGYLSC